MQKVEVEGGLLDPFVELAIVREEPLDMLGLRDQAGELAVKGDEVGGLYFFKNEIDLLLEIPGVNLHDSYQLINIFFFHKYINTHHYNCNLSQNASLFFAYYNNLRFTLSALFITFGCGASIRNFCLCKRGIHPEFSPPSPFSFSFSFYRASIYSSNNRLLK